VKGHPMHRDFKADAEYETSAQNAAS